jgi:hypothetical protein
MDRCFAVRCPLSAIRYPPFLAPSSKLPAKYFQMKFVDDLHFVFKYMRATAGRPSIHASQNKIHTHND